MWLSIICAVVVTTALGLTIYNYFKSRGIYSDSEYKPLYYLRWLGWRLTLWWHLRCLPLRMNNYSTDIDDVVYNGMAPTPEECSIEQPVTLLTDRYEDTVTIWGTDDSGRAVFARVSRLTNNRTSVTFLVKDGTGDIYTIPNQPDTTIHHVADSTWSGAGLWLDCVRPMRTWRLKFNGYLRKGPRLDYVTAVSDEDDSDLVEARISLVWKALGAPIDIFRESDPKLLASALARDPEADMQYFRSLLKDAYDQPGMLTGTVVLDTSAPEGEDGHLRSQPSGLAEDMKDSHYWWCLRGSRQRRWGMSDGANKVHRSVEFMGYFKNGSSMYQHTFSCPGTLPHCSFGYLTTITGDYKPFSDTTFSLNELPRNYDIPSQAHFHCSGKFSNGNVCFTLDKGAVSCYTGDPWTLRHDIVFSDVHFGDNTGVGIAVYTESFTGLCPVPEQYSGSLFSETSLEVVMPLSGVAARDVTVAGGKGSSLAYLSSLDPHHCPEQVFVPAGVVVSTSAWRAQVAATPSVSAALSALRTALCTAQETHIKESCVRAVNAFLQSSVCPEVRDAITTQLRWLYGTTGRNHRFAVRSSGSDEDSCEASAAGQHLTVLGCQGLQAILRSVVECWASLVSFSSVQYKRQRGLEPIGEMAVVVQEMVDAEVAGVIFTRHPTSGSPASILITANYGLGESIVSGSSEPDTIIVRRSWRDTLRLKSCSIGTKRFKHVLDENTSSEVAVEKCLRSECCISEELALRLAAVAVHLEKAFRSPRDIEFAIAMDRIYLLQARPITTLESWTESELLSELDTASPSENEIYTRANTGEVIPAPSSPLSISLFQATLDNVTARSSYFNIRPNYSCPRFIVVNHMYMCISVLEALLRMPSRKVCARTVSSDLGLFGHVVTTEDFLKRAADRHGYPSAKVTLQTMGLLLWRIMTNGVTISRARREYRRYSIDLKRAVTAEEVYRKVCSEVPEFMKASVVHFKMSMVSNALQMISFQILAAGKDDITDAMVADMSKMLSACCEAQHSAGIPGALASLAEVIRKDEEVDDFLAMTPEEGSVWLRSHPGRVGLEFQKFIDEHGHRCIQELEMCVPSWRSDCTTLVQALQTMVSNGFQSSSSKPSAARRLQLLEILDSLSQPLTPRARRVLGYLLPKARVGVLRREAAKSCLVRVHEAFKNAYRRLGELMVSEARLPEPTLIYYLQHHEIGLLLKKRSPKLIDKARKRKRLRDKLANIKLPEIMDGRYNAFSEPAPSGEDILPECLTTVRGTTACAGRAVVGRARVILSAKETVDIKPGEILITYSTDVGWTPYFNILSGLVTEIGGLVSHGAVVAREYGLPCLVGAVGAVQVFSTGDRVELNTEKGIISKIDDAQLTPLT